jgi:hypothetical protein
MHTPPRFGNAKIRRVVGPLYKCNGGYFAAGCRNLVSCEHYHYFHCWLAEEAAQDFLYLH